MDTLKIEIALFEQEGQSPPTDNHSSVGALEVKKWLPILNELRNRLMVSEEAEILKILMKGLPVIVVRGLESWADNAHASSTILRFLQPRTLQHKVKICLLKNNSAIAPALA